ncbi:MAG: F0F1 ATP synthase subunit gamma [Pseudomonadota bacterium]
MPSLKDLRNRISSVTATRKITKAMQMVAAAKLRRAQTAAEAARPYAEKMSAVLSNLAAGQMADGGDGVSPLLAGTGSDKVHLLVVATAERGLCGAFNSSIVRLARQHTRKLLDEGKEVKILTVGKKGYDQLKRDMSSRIVEQIDFRNVKSIGFGEADEVSSKVMEMFEAGEFDVCTLYYAAFKSVISQVPTAQQLIPAEFTVSDDPVLYEYEPDESAILDDLLPRNMTVQIFSALLENAASEQGARMAAMDNATRNAGEMIDGLTLSYNRQRQAQITKELIEIISGAEAL